MGRRRVKKRGFSERGERRGEEEGEEGCGLEQLCCIVRLLLRLTGPPFIQPLGRDAEVDGGQRDGRRAADVTAQTWQSQTPFTRLKVRGQKKWYRNPDVRLLIMQMVKKKNTPLFNVHLLQQPGDTTGNK